MILGHLTRMAVWNLKRSWNTELPTVDKLARFSEGMARLADAEEVLDILASADRPSLPSGPLFAAAEANERGRDAVAF